MQLSLSSGHAVRQCGLHPRGLPAEVPTAARAQTRRCCREPSSSSFSAIRTPNIAESQVTRLPTADVPDTAGGSGSRNGSEPRDLDLLQQRRESELHASTSGVAVAEEVTQSTVSEWQQPSSSPNSQQSFFSSSTVYSGHLSCSIPNSRTIHCVAGMQVERLVSSGNPALSMAEIASAFKFPLDDFQKQAVEDILAGHSVVVCAPTGAGKTAIAEAATIAVLARCAQSHPLRPYIIKHPHSHFSSQQRTVTRRDTQIVPTPLLLAQASSLGSHCGLWIPGLIGVCMAAGASGLSTRRR